jgi:transcription elongation GreA/GreB family factor
VSVCLPVDYKSLQFLFDRRSELEVASLDPDALLDRAQLKRSEDTLRRQGFTEMVDWAYSELQDFDPTRLAQVMRAIIAKNMVDKAFTIHGGALQDYDGQDFDRIRGEIVERDRELIQMSRKVIRQGLLRNARPPQGNGIGRKSTYTEMSLIINEMNKRRNRLGIRELTQRAGQALLELKPCWMMSPLAVAQYLHEGMEFDLVVIDEASQMTPENAIGALSRAGQAIVVGDTKQLPPTSFFRKMLDDDDIDEDLREDSESILDMANVAFMPIRQLRWHYRSRHSALIQFSNKMMYKEELTIFPSPREDDPEMGVHIVEVPGAYKSGRNEIEALEKAKRQAPPKLTPVSAVEIIDDNVQNVDRPMSKDPLEEMSKLGRMAQGTLQIGGRDDLFSYRVVAEKAAETFAPQVKTERIAIETGSNVKVESLSDGGKKLSFKLVDGKNDPDNGLVGIHSPLGAALLDAEVGESVEYQVGSYVREVKVLEIS